MTVVNKTWNAKLAIAATTAALAGAALIYPSSVLAQDVRSGVSHPAPVVITSDASDDAAISQVTPQKPSAAISATAATSSSPTVYGPYVPYRGPSVAASPTASQVAAFDPDASIVTSATAGQADRRLLAGPSASPGKPDIDAGIVTRVPSIPGELAEGTLVKAKLREELSTLSTQPGTKFTAEVTEPVMREGSVIVPTGSILEGRVTWVRSGKRIGGPAALHLEPRTIALPDGSQYVLRARAIDTSSWQNTKVDSEGTITRSENKKRNVGVMSLTTGAGLAAGAMIAGVPGAVVGASVGAGVSTIVWLKQDRQAVLPKNLGLVFSLTEPMSVTPAVAAVASVQPASTHAE